MIQLVESVAFTDISVAGCNVILYFVS